MLITSLPSLGVVLLAAAAAHASIAVDIKGAQAACSSLKELSPSMLVAGPGSTQYALDIEHFSPSATQNATCTVEPKTPAEVAQLLKIINSTRTAWAVKGHGHNYNQGFSSTTGLQISLSQFKEVSYDPKTKLARIGTGTSWDKVYPVLDAQGVMVVGGRIVGVGTGGLTLGGGWSYKTNQFGLASDNTVEYDLVTYAGEILQVTASSNPDLFFALQGGGNNFGIVTSFTTKTHVQTRVVAGLLTVTGQNMTDFKKAIVNFSATNKDPKADVNPVFVYSSGQLSAFAFLLYDAPTLPNNTFSDFIALGASLTQTTYSEYVASFPEPDSDAPTRWAGHPAPIRGYPMELMDFIVNETESWGHLLTTKHSGTNVTNTAEMFLLPPSSSSRDSAYPHSGKQFSNPFDTGAMWLNASEDAFFNNAVKTMAGRIQAKAIALGQSSADGIIYSNYAVADTPVRLFYGNNVARLANISRSHDPFNLLSLTGGFKLNT